MKMYHRNVWKDARLESSLRAYSPKLARSISRALQSVGGTADHARLVEIAQGRDVLPTIGPARVLQLKAFLDCYAQTQPITLATTNPAAQHLIAALNTGHNRIIYDELVQCQDEAIAAGEPPMAIPLVWLAMLNLAGFTVDPATGQIVDGPEDDILRSVCHRPRNRGIAYAFPAEGLQLAGEVA